MVRVLIENGGAIPPVSKSYSAQGRTVTVLVAVTVSTLLCEMLAVWLLLPLCVGVCVPVLLAEGVCVPVSLLDTAAVAVDVSEVVAVWLDVSDVVGVIVAVSESELVMLLVAVLEVDAVGVEVVVLVPVAVCVRELVMLGDQLAVGVFEAEGVWLTLPLPFPSSLAIGKDRARSECSSHRSSFARTTS